MLMTHGALLMNISRKYAIHYNAQQIKIKAKTTVLETINKHVKTGSNVPSYNVKYGFGNP